MSDTMMTLWEGLGNNLLITLLSSVMPFGIGVVFSFLASKNKTVEKVFGWISLPTEVLCPIIWMLVVYYVPSLFFDVPLNNRVGVAVFSLATAFVGYMPARYVHDFSFLKNVVYNGLGLLSCLFKWSFAARVIAVAELAMASERCVAVTFDATSPVIALLLATAVIAVLEIAKRLVKYGMK